MTNVSLTNLIEQTILDQMRCKASFTALDISNTLKFHRFPVTHREVAASVREIYASGAMAYFDYDRKVIPVVTDGGTKQTRAFLYHFAQVPPRTYQTRNQEALPPVPLHEAQDMTDYSPVSPLPVRTPIRRIAPQRGHRRSRTRRDGALSVPRHFLLQLGWTDGQMLSLTASGGGISVQPASADSAALRVWDDCRLRVCRTKLGRGRLTAGNVQVSVDGNRLKLSATLAGAA